MERYRVEVGSFVTRLVTRNITVVAENEYEAKQKAIRKYQQLEEELSNSVDSGSPQVDRISRVLK